MGLEDAIAAVKRLKALAKAEVLESEAFGLSEQQITFPKKDIATTQPCLTD